MEDAQEARLRLVAIGLMGLAVLLALAGVAIAFVAARNLTAIGSGLIVDADSVRRMLRSYQRIGGAALPLIAIAVGGCGIAVRRTLKRSTKEAEQGGGHVR